MILKLSLLTALFYVGFALLVEAGILVAAKKTGGFGLFASTPVWFVLFGIFWLISFSLAWRLVGPFSRWIP